MNWIFLFFVFIVTMIAVWFYWRGRGFLSAIYILFACPIAQVLTYLILDRIKYDAPDVLALVIGISFCFFCGEKKVAEEVVEIIKKPGEIDVYV